MVKFVGREIKNQRENEAAVTRVVLVMFVRFFAGD